MHGSILIQLLQLFLLAAPGGSAQCHTRIAAPHRADGAWIYDLAIDTDTLAVAGISVAENGIDVTLTIERGDDRASVDVAPTRYAIERVLAPVWRRGSARAAVRGFERAIDQQPPDVAPLCATWREPMFLPLLAWQAMATAAQRSESDADAATRDAARTLALTMIDALLDPATARSVPRDLAAGAEHERGFILSRRARHVDAQRAFVHAQSLWREAGRETQARAAEFNAAQELLAAGRATQALAALQPLLGDAVQRQTPGIANWAHNDYCLTLRALDRRDDAVRCFAALVPRLQAANEIKEAGNALCNWGAALGTARRWSQAAQVLQRCEAARRQIGLPAGLAQAHLLLGWIALETGEIGGAITQFDSALDYAGKSGDASRIWDAQRWLAQAWLDADELPRARAAIRSRQPDPEQDPSRFAQWRMALGQIALVDEDLPAALDNLRAAASRLDALGLQTTAQDVRCQLALIDRDVALSPQCDELSAAQAYLARAGDADASRFLATASAGVEARLLRRLLRFKIDSTTATIDVRRGRDVLAAALALVSADPAADQVRGQLLARIGFEFAQLAHDRGDAALARLALDALLAGRQTHGALSVDLVQRRTPTFAVRADNNAGAVSARRGEVLIASASLLGTTLLVVDGGPDASVKVVEIATNALRDAIERWRYAVATDQDVTANTLALSGLLQLATWWRPHTDRLVVAAHGALADVAWAALAVDGAAVARLGYRPLVADAAVVQLAGKPESPRPAAATRALGIFAETSADELPGVAEEVGSIEAIARSAHWQIEQVSEQSAFDGRRLDVFHIAGHAVTDRIDEASNTLRTGDDAVRWPAQWIAHSALVVLAGCDTAQGPRSRWQAAGSLARRALDGGASVVLAHIWPIPDRPAARLHADFYRFLFDGAHADEALALAQRARLSTREDSIVRNWASAVILSHGADLSSALPVAQR